MNTEHKEVPMQDALEICGVIFIVKSNDLAPTAVGNIKAYMDKYYIPSALVAYTKDIWDAEAIVSHYDSQR